MKIYTIPLLLLSAALLSCEGEKKQTVAIQELPVADTKNTQQTAKREEIVAYAKEYLGTSYCYAGGDPKTGFDCSGFVNFVFKHFGITLPRSSSGFTKLGKPLQPSEFQVGDVLVFYGYRDSGSVGHVGIICEANGMQSKFIHASSGSEMAVTISELGSEMYTRRFYKCIDPFKI
jgi:cell wall-associated NlpC family hydrolase